MTVHEGNSDLGKNRWPGINQRLFQDTEMDSMWQIRLTTHIQEGTANSVPDGEGEVAQSCPTLCDPMDCSLPGSSLHGILQARILEWVATSFSRGSSQPRDWTLVSHIAGRCFNLWATREAQTSTKWKIWWSTLHSRESHSLSTITDTTWSLDWKNVGPACTLILISTPTPELYSFLQTPLAWDPVWGH